MVCAVIFARLTTTDKPASVMNTQPKIGTALVAHVTCSILKQSIADLKCIHNTVLHLKLIYVTGILINASIVLFTLKASLTLILPW